MQSTTAFDASIATRRSHVLALHLHPRIAARRRAPSRLTPKMRLLGAGVALAAALLVPVLAWEPPAQSQDAIADVELPPLPAGKALAGAIIEDCPEPPTAAMELFQPAEEPPSASAAAAAAPADMPASAVQMRIVAPGESVESSEPAEPAATPAPQAPAENASGPLGASGSVRAALPREQAVERLLAAMRRVESGGNDRAVGDGGDSLGPLQVQRGAWADAARQLAAEGRGGAPAAYRAGAFSYSMSCTVARAYWRRYCPRAYARGDLQCLARTWNGGPRGASSAATLVYWRRVSRELKSLSLEPAADGTVSARTSHRKEQRT